MPAFIYFIVFLSNIFLINTQNLFSSNIFIKTLYKHKFQRFNKQYNISIKIILDKNITNEFFINSTYISKLKSYDFLYTGKFFYLNDTNIDLLSNNNYENQFILLINSNLEFQQYINNNRSLIKYLTKLIIVPKNIIQDFDINSKLCFKQLSILLLELEENIFNQILNNYNYNNYYAKVISKKIEIFPFRQLYLINIFTSFFLFTFSLIYKYAFAKYEYNYREKQIYFLNDLKFFIYSKIFILLLLFIELNLFYNFKGFFFDNISFLKVFSFFFMAFNKVEITYFFFSVYFGKGIFVKERNGFQFIKMIFTGFIMIFYIFFHVFMKPSKNASLFYYLSLISYAPTFLSIVLFSFKNIIFLFKANYLIRKVERFNNIYGKSIRLKLYMTFSQFLIILFYAYFFLGIHEYLLFKKGLYFGLEKDFLFQSLESWLILLLALIYIPRNWPNGFNLRIKYKKSRIKVYKLQINEGLNYKSTIPKGIITSRKENKMFIKKNKRKYFIIIKPKAFLDKEKDNKDVNVVAEYIKLGKVKIFS